MAFEFKTSIKSSWVSNPFTPFHFNGVGVEPLHLQLSRLTSSLWNDLKRLAFMDYLLAPRECISKNGNNTLHQSLVSKFNSFNYQHGCTLLQKASLKSQDMLSCFFLHAGSQEQSLFVSASERMLIPVGGCLWCPVNTMAAASRLLGEAADPCLL